MPTYDYACKACKHAFEHFQPMGDKLLRTCPACGKRQLERLIGAGSGIVFRGSGFYETDYKRKPRKDEPAGADAKSDTPAKGGEGSGGSKSGGSQSDGSKPGGSNSGEGASRDKPAGAPADSASGKASSKPLDTSRGKPSGQD